MFSFNNDRYLVHEDVMGDLPTLQLRLQPPGTSAALQIHPFPPPEMLRFHSLLFNKTLESFDSERYKNNMIISRAIGFYQLTCKWQILKRGAQGDVCGAKLETFHVMMNENENKTLFIIVLFVFYYNIQTRCLCKSALMIDQTCSIHKAFAHSTNPSTPLRYDNGEDFSYFQFSDMNQTGKWTERRQLIGIKFVMCLIALS